MAESRESSNARFIVTLMAIISFAIGAVMWATNSHAELKEWAVGQDFVTKTELKETMKDQYVPLSRFIRLETQLEEATKTNEQVLESLKELKDKIDSIKRKN